MKQCVSSKESPVASDPAHLNASTSTSATSTSARGPWTRWAPSAAPWGASAAGPAAPRSAPRGSRAAAATTAARRERSRGRTAESGVDGEWMETGEGGTPLLFSRRAPSGFVFGTSSGLVQGSGSFLGRGAEFGCCVLCFFLGGRRLQEGDGRNGRGGWRNASRGDIASDIHTHTLIYTTGWLL